MKYSFIASVKYKISKHKKVKGVLRKGIRLYRTVKQFPRVRKMHQTTVAKLPSRPDQDAVVWYFCEAEHANLGDLAQRICIEDWIRDNYSGLQVYKIPTLPFLYYKKSMLTLLKKLIKEEDLVIFQSGYTMTGIHPDDRLRQLILPIIKNNPILFFPQTINYEDRKMAEVMGTLLGECRKLLLLVRDQKSFDTAKQLFPNVKMELFPDIVTTKIGKKEYSAHKRSGITLCIRNDGEKYFSYQQMEALRKKLSAVDDVEVTDTDSDDLNSFDIKSVREAIDKKISYFAGKKLIITDRYHGTIFSLAAGTPVIVLKTKDHKVITGVEWFKDVYHPFIFYCDQLESVPALVRKIMAASQFEPLQPYFKEKYYDTLKERFLEDKLVSSSTKEQQRKEISNGICMEDICTGCMACLNTCPHKAISVGTDERGFYMPIINRDLCTDCGVCRKICPALHKPSGNHEPKKVYAMWSKDALLRKNSSSGAVFSGLAKWILDQDGLVYGCALNEEHVAEHICISSLEELDQLRGSKYVQSRIGDIYSSVKVALKEGWKVLFTGTPCQIAGLKAFLGHADCTNLYSMDIICHGVPSPMAFSDYMKASEEKQKARAKNISFRHKDPGWTNFSMRIEYENERIYQEIGRKDPYLNAFLKDCLTRDCCHTCPYTSTQRMGDLTAGDFWSYVSVSHEVRNDEKGISIVLVNNEKGQRMLQAIKKDYVLQERTVSEGKRGNRCLSRPYPPSASKDLFWKTYLADRDFLKAADQCVPKKKPSLKHRISEEVNRYYYLLPGFAKKLFLKMLKMK